MSDKIIDVQVDEARRLAELQVLINEKFAYSPKDIGIWARLRDEVTARAAEIGFIVNLIPEDDGMGNWIPVCEIIGRTDSRLDRILQEEGPDRERKAFDSARVSSDELRLQGVDPELLA